MNPEVLNGIKDAAIYLIILVIIGIVGFVVKKICPKIKDQIDANTEKIENEMLREFIRYCIMAAEEKFKDAIKAGTEKKEYVKQQTKEYLDSTLHIQLTDAQLDMLIDGIFKELDNNNEVNNYVPVIKDTNEEEIEK